MDTSINPEHICPMSMRAAPKNLISWTSWFPFFLSSTFRPSSLKRTLSGRSDLDIVNTLILCPGSFKYLTCTYTILKRNAKKFEVLLTGVREVRDRVTNTPIQLHTLLVGENFSGHNFAGQKSSRSKIQPFKSMILKKNKMQQNFNNSGIIHILSHRRQGYNRETSNR